MTYVLRDMYILNPGGSSDFKLTRIGHFLGCWRIVLGKDAWRGRTRSAGLVGFAFSAPRAVPGGLGEILSWKPLYQHRTRKAPLLPRRRHTLHGRIEACLMPNLLGSRSNRTHDDQICMETQHRLGKRGIPEAR